jgi:uncharacterized protein YwgA
MSDVAQAPWQRLVAISKLAEAFAEKSVQFGKTALQKTVYLLQELYSLDLEYRFGLHTYGPFCPELLSDLDFAEALDLVEIRRSSEGDGFDIAPKAPATFEKRTTDEFKGKLADSIRRLLRDFGGRTARELELLSTIIFIDREPETTRSEEELVRLVREIKPKFPEAEIKASMDNLQAKGFLTQNGDFI